MEPIKPFTAKAVAIAIDNVDTDQIIPAQYLKAVDKADMAEGLFAAWRRNADGSVNEDFPLNRPEHAGAGVLIAGHNFGCGSSREHAGWALQGYGFKAVISTDFADIFRSNALKIGLLPIVVDAETHAQLLSMCEEDPDTRVSIDLAAQQVLLDDGRAVSFPIEPFAKYCLLNGVDQLGFLLSQNADIAAYENAQPGRIQTTAEVA
ncbi:MAG: 3-isopropylmalate dehydratase small subunit [Chloroflexales bacterium]|nr:3-isopropylmalate dehydratase small subunit [Chloroflexales bacterium]